MGELLTFQPSTIKANMSHLTEIKTQIKDTEALRRMARS